MELPIFIPASVLLTATLCLLLLYAVWSDVKSRRIPNRLVFCGAALGLTMNLLLPGAVGFWQALAGLGIGLAVLLPMYVMRAMGAGDVKLMAMVGAFLGAGAMPGALAATFLSGGILALLVAARSGTLRRLLDNLRTMLLSFFFTLALREIPVLDSPPETSAGTLPYAVPIAAGTLAYLALAGNVYMNLLKMF